MSERQPTAGNSSESGRRFSGLRSLLGKLPHSAEMTPKPPQHDRVSAPESRPPLSFQNLIDRTAYYFHEYESWVTGQDPETLEFQWSANTVEIATQAAILEIVDGPDSAVSVEAVFRTVIDGTGLRPNDVFDIDNIYRESGTWSDVQAKICQEILQEEVSRRNPEFKYEESFRLVKYPVK